MSWAGAPQEKHLTALEFIGDYANYES